MTTTSVSAASAQHHDDALCTMTRALTLSDAVQARNSPAPSDSTTDKGTRVFAKLPHDLLQESLSHLIYPMRINSTTDFAKALRDLFAFFTINKEAAAFGKQYHEAISKLGLQVINSNSIQCTPHSRQAVEFSDLIRRQMTAIEFSPYVANNLPELAKNVLTLAHGILTLAHGIREFRLPRLILTKDACTSLVPLQPRSLDLSCCVCRYDDPGYSSDWKQAELAGLALFKNTLQEISFGSRVNYEIRRWGSRKEKEKSLNEEQAFFLQYQKAQATYKEQLIEVPLTPSRDRLRFMAELLPGMRSFSNTFYPYILDDLRDVYKEIGKLKELEHLLLSLNFGNEKGDHTCVIGNVQSYITDCLSLDHLRRLEGLTKLKSIALTSCRGGWGFANLEVIEQLIRQFPLLEEVSLPILVFLNVGLQPFHKLANLRSLDICMPMSQPFSDALCEELAKIPKLERVHLQVNSSINDGPTFDFSSLSRLKSLHTLILTSQVRDSLNWFNPAFCKELRRVLPHSRIVLDDVILFKGPPEKSFAQ